VGICRIWSFVGIFKYIGLHLQYLSGPYEHSRGIIMGFLLHLHRRLSEPFISQLFGESGELCVDFADVYEYNRETFPNFDSC